jgi:hypothetical protein
MGSTAQRSASVYSDHQPLPPAVQASQNDLTGDPEQAAKRSRTGDCQQARSRTTTDPQRRRHPQNQNDDLQLAAVQLCCAHLLRSLREIGELDIDPYRIQRAWTDPAAAALLDAKAAVDKARTAGATALDGDELAGHGPATTRRWPGASFCRLGLRIVALWRILIPGCG